MAGEAEILVFGLHRKIAGERPFDAAAQRQSAKSGRLGEVFGQESGGRRIVAIAERATEIADRGADLAEQETPSLADKTPYRLPNVSDSALG